MDAVLHFKEDLRRFGRAYPAESAGLKAAGELSDCIDVAVSNIWKSVEGPVSGTALVAIGGYGRRHMCPQSDIDLLVVSRKRDGVAEPVRRLSYALWDTGFELGLLTATEKEAHKLAAGDFDTKCAFLDARLVCGDAGLFESFSERTLKDTRGSSEKFVQALRTASEQRWLSAGDAGAELEPDLKRSKGGLRDIAALGWISAVAGRIRTPEELRLLEKGLDVLLTVRQGLHLHTGRPTDLLSMQVQIPVAERLGMDEYELMRRLYEACRPATFAVENALLGDDPLGHAGREFVHAFGAGSPQTEPAAAGRPRPEELQGTSEKRQGPSPLGSHEFQGSAVHPEWPVGAREAFWEILRAGEGGRRAFRAIDVLGALPAALPEWNGIRHRAQRNIYHRWAVDIHCYETVCELQKLKESEDPLLRRVAADSGKDWESLLLAALLHDIGKGGGQDHSELGERLADKCTARMGVRASAARDVSWLIKYHLLLPQVATRRDISEEALIIDLAERMGSERRLRMLLLLCVADARATGPAAWTPWKANLITQLFSEVHHLLERKELVGGDASRKASAQAGELRAELRDFEPAQVERHLATMPRAWLISQTSQALLRQSRLMLEPSDCLVRLHARQEEEEIWEVTVVAADRPGLFSKISGVLALHGFDVVSAQIFTREDGLALEIFRVEAPASREDRFNRVAADAERVMEGGLSLAEALGRKRRDYAGRVEKGKREPPEVIIDNRASDFFTVIEVHGTDRIGLLYEITSALADLGMDIHLAKVATYAEDVVDSFYVRDLDGQKVTDADRLRVIEATVLNRVLSAAPDSI